MSSRHWRGRNRVASSHSPSTNSLIQWDMFDTKSLTGLRLRSDPVVQNPSCTQLAALPPDAIRAGRIAFGDGGFHSSLIPRAALDAPAPAKVRLDVATLAATQAAQSGFQNCGAHPQHRIELLEALRRRLETPITALAEHCPDLHVRPEGGICLGAQLRMRLLGQEVQTAATNNGLSIRCDDFLPTYGGASSHIRLRFAASAFNDVVSGDGRRRKALRAVLRLHGRSAAVDCAFASVR